MPRRRKRHTPEPVPEPSRDVPGFSALTRGQVRALPYPILIYQLDGDDTSGIAGTLHPDGTYQPLPANPCPHPIEWWDDSLKRKIAGTCSWDGTNQGSLELGPTGGPHRRTWDASLTGEWPNHPETLDPIKESSRKDITTSYRQTKEEETHFGA